MPEITTIQRGSKPGVVLTELVDVATVARPRAADQGGVIESIVRSGERAVIAAIPFAKTSHFIKNQVQWLDKFRTVTGVREDLYSGSDTSTLPANSGTVIQAIISPKGNLILGPWQNTEYYLSVGQGFHSNDLRGVLTPVDALATEINFQQATLQRSPSKKRNC